MTSILCLAHYCDTHGPTPLMVTEELPAPCTTCLDPPPTPTPPPLRLPLPQPLRLLQPPHKLHPALAPAPPVANPLHPACLPAHGTAHTPPRLLFSKNLRRSRSQARHPMRKLRTHPPAKGLPLTIHLRFDITLHPPPAADDSTSPILRTRKPFALVSSASSTPKHSPSPSDSDEPDSAPAPSRRRRSIPRSVAASHSQKHTHYLDYTSSHDPSSTTTFSLLRAACLRTLSCETLPPSSPTPQPAGGPLFFGDPLAGYTTAFLFRIPDPWARGRRRVYAFLCLSVLSERKAMRVFGFLAGAFRELAGWIQGLAEAGNSESGIAEGGIDEEGGGRGRGEREPRIRSSFLGSRGDERGRGVRARGLAEVVGRPDFFIELHVRFVALAAQLRFLVEGGRGESFVFRQNGVTSTLRGAVGGG
ncbi:hypothetical protein GMDG_01325 [Pseudogymnoascus destructans 20631-21]|uniref:UDENN FLCN/SMCR8-type domain-containing protein n=1 Tax=Pseudogymnoascus destructans (strain ATCC MYA-4855 / 20631-21) TaxID=658429 RepID=L8FVL9_PSED2|nr:hypothetical protein GMDG_01325 [Pseudogymnoascus destructans 20631-21]